MATLYRKYRPQTFGDVIGQGHIRQTLQAALKMDKVAHAYLFAGPRGTGKTTMARLLAKAINCKSLESRSLNLEDSHDQNSKFQIPNSNPEPCNACQLCKEITEGRSLDVIEIDAASNRGIDEIRELREKIKFAPSQGKAKVFIIDEVHMLTKEAFNALLKTLEEPPAHAVFVLATTESHKVPVTIASRCQVFIFKKAQQADIVGRLTHVAASETLEFEPAALEFLAKMASGSYRDALSLFDQVSSVEVGPLTLANVQHVLGLATEERILEIFQAVQAGDSRTALLRLTDLEAAGVDLERLASQLVDAGRWLLYAKLGAEKLTAETNEVYQAAWQTLATGWSEADITTMIQTLMTAKLAMKQSPIASLPLEVALVKLAKGKEQRGKSEETDGSKKSEVRSQDILVTGEEQKVKGKEIRENDEEVLGNGEQEYGSLNMEAGIQNDSDLNVSITDQQNDGLETEDELIGVADDEVFEDTQNSKFHPPIGGPNSFTVDDWQVVLGKLRAHNASLHGLLQQARFGGVVKERLVLHVPFKFAAERVNDRKHKQSLEGLIAEVTGSAIQIDCQVESGQQSASGSQSQADASVAPEVLDAATELFGT